MKALKAIAGPSLRSTRRSQRQNKNCGVSEVGECSSRGEPPIDSATFSKGASLHVGDADRGGMVAPSRPRLEYPVNRHNGARSVAALWLPQPNEIAAVTAAEFQHRSTKFPTPVASWARAVPHRCAEQKKGWAGQRAARQ